MPLKSPEYIEKEVELFITDLQRAAWNNTPAINSTKNSISGIIYPFEIRQMVNEKKKIRKRWQQSRAPQHKTELNRLSNKLKERIKEIKNATISSYLQKLTADKSTDYSLWRATKGLKRLKVQALPIRKDNNE